MDAVCESWYVLRVVSGTDKKVTERLDRLSCRYFLVERTVRSYHKRYGTILEKVYPAFPGYIFLQEPSNWRAVNDLEGVIGPLGDDQPERLPDDVMPLIWAASIAGDFNSGLPEKWAPKKNERVTPTVGPLFGKIGTVIATQGNNKLRVLFDHMIKMVTVPVDMVEAA